MVYIYSMKKFLIFIVSVAVGFLGCSATPAQDYSQVSIIDVAKDKETLRPALQEIGIKTAMEKLVAETRGGSTFDCHQEAHNIGRIGYEIYKEEAFRQCDANCHSGCYHGAMEMFLREKGTANLAQNIKKVCDSFETQFGIFECLHGVGHGVLAYTDYDMPEALKKCGELKDSYSQTSCYGGLFMENILTAQGLGAAKGTGSGEEEYHETEWANKTDPHFPCNGIDQDFDLQYQCYQMQTSWMLYLNNYDFDRVAAECLKAPENMRSVCFKSYGRDASGNSLRDPVKIKETCAKAPRQKDFYEQCVTGAVNVIIDFWGPGLRGQASELCKMLDETGKKTCYEVVSQRVVDLFATAQEQDVVCETFESGFKDLCGGTVTTSRPSAEEPQKTPGSDDEPAAENVTIEIFKDEFRPKNATIKKGGTVTFVNKGWELHWPASNIHPSHEVYPEFDVKRGMKTGESWSFVFDKEGEWRFHDHLFPKMGGEVKVIGEFS